MADKNTHPNDAPAVQHAAHEHKHTSPWVVFGVLAVLTAIEIVMSISIPGTAKNAPLLAISLVKAGLVALYYMHLRYEKPIYGFIFVAPAIFGVLLALILLNV
jgi:caa(3)-type oxidase subunit IV